MLPPAPIAPAAITAAVSGRPRRRRWIGFGVVAALLVSATIGAAVVPMPYIAVRPGSVRPVTEHVVVEGAPSYAPDHSIAYTTVGVGQTTMLEALVGWIDDDVDILPEERVRGSRSEDENRRYNAQLMDDSKLIAEAVALERLGEDVHITTTTGAIVRRFIEGSPAAAALELDDVIVAIDGNLVDVPGEVGDLLQPGGPGATHTLTVERPAGSDTHLEIAVSTIPADNDPTRAIIGIEPQDRISDFDFPIDVTIDSGTVGGPSAGLAFTLAILDVLTPGELTGGHRVAVTGTMSLDGTVGPVGGGAQKAITVRDAGYEVFLVPSDEADEVREAVGDDLIVVPVDTLDEALLALGVLGGNVEELPASSTGVASPVIARRTAAAAAGRGSPRASAPCPGVGPSIGSPWPIRSTARTSPATPSGWVVRATSSRRSGPSCTRCRRSWSASNGRATSCGSGPSGPKPAWVCQPISTTRCCSRSSARRPRAS